MNFFSRIVLFCCLAMLSTTLVRAQKLTGTWEGYMKNEFIQINIKQQGTKICGYTYDFVLNDKKSFCRAFFSGRYEDGFLLITGTNFIANSGEHVLMTLGFLVQNVDGQTVLRGKADTRTLRTADLTNNYAEIITMRRTGSKPQNAPGTNFPCFVDTVKKVTKSEVLPVPPAKPKEVVIDKNTGVAPKKNTEIEVRKDVPSIPKVVPKVAPVTPARTVQMLPQKIRERKLEEQARVDISVRKINIKIYDNGTVDDDTVSVFYNGRNIVNKQRLSEDAIILNLTLDEGINLHEFVLYADNLGSIPPNTALIIITAGDKRYELRSSADLRKNAVLVLNYKAPDLQ